MLCGVVWCVGQVKADMDEREAQEGRAKDAQRDTGEVRTLEDAQPMGVECLGLVLMNDVGSGLCVLRVAVG
jgi:hypothetical protein